MGSAESRFRDAVRAGNVEAAHELYFNKRSGVRSRLQPNVSLGASYDENTLLHYAAKHGMQRLYEDMLSQGGRPDHKAGRRRGSAGVVGIEGARSILR